MNLVVLRGVLARPPVERTLQSGERLVFYDLSVPAPSGTAHESVPVVWVDPPAGAVPSAVGEEIVVIGRVRRRFFKAGGSVQSRTEVVASKLLPARRAKAAERAVNDALAEAEEAFIASAA